MTSRIGRLALHTACGLLAISMLAACAPEDDAAQPEPTGSVSPSAPAPEETDPAPSPTPTPEQTPAQPAEIPDDCRAILNDAVLAELGDTPLNDPSAGIPTGVQEDGSLVCLWRDPRADTTGLYTKISHMPTEAAEDLLSMLPDEGFTCSEPDGGTRCEKTWANQMYPVTDGRTVYWRDGILIDTDYSNLAPEGYTSAIVASIWG